jgi:hypothetical protein
VTALERQILERLLTLEQTVAAMATTNPKPSLAPILSDLGRLTRELPLGTDPQLLHYLHKHSFEKARLSLQGRDAENVAGNCLGHVDEQGRPVFFPKFPA